MNGAFVPPGGKLPVGGWLGAAFRLTVGNVGWLLLFALLTIVAPLLALVFVAVAVDVMGLEPDIPLLFGAVLIALSVIASYAAEVDLLYRRLEGGPPGFGRSLATAGRRIWAILGLLLIGLVVFVALASIAWLVGAVVPSELLMTVQQRLAESSAAMSATMIGAMLLISIAVVPLTLLAILAFVSCVVERRGPLGALVRGARLLRGNWLRAGGALFLVGLAYLVGMFAIAATIGVAAMDPDEQFQIDLTAQLVLFATAVCFNLFVTSLFVTLHGMLRRLRDGDASVAA